MIMLRIAHIIAFTEFNRPSSGGGMSKCYLTFDAEFKWTTDDTPHVPIMSGGLLAMSRRWFFEIGGYDKSMMGWGGENLDQSLRIWNCGGEIVSAPDSFVAHMWRDGSEKTKAKYKLGAGDAIKNRARAMKAHLGAWYDKTLTFPSFHQWRQSELDTSSITDGFSELSCHNFEWYLNRFKYIYKNAGVLPKEVFQIEASSSSEGNPQCLKLRNMGWTNYGTADDLVLVDCLDGSPKDPKPQYWHLSNRLKNKTCCGSLRAWNTDQCIDGRNPREGETKVSTYVCDLDSGMEAVLRPSEEKDGVFVLALGRGKHHGALCAGIEDSRLKIVDCSNASTWKKRNPFTPVEYELLSAETKQRWEREDQ